MDLPLPASIVALPESVSQHLISPRDYAPIPLSLFGEANPLLAAGILSLFAIFFLLFACSRSSAPFVVRLFLNLIMAMAAAAMLAVACLGIAVGFHIPF
jgi:glucan phosphoethanolaminetransferase (alkaline phosphatase superfamily)